MARETVSFVVIIPARYASSRLPGKPLRLAQGKPLLRHAYDSACGSGAQRVWIATDDPRVQECAQGFSAEVVMTGEHVSGTDRIAEAADRCGLPDDTVIINVQGDEYALPPALIDQLAELKESAPQAEIATLYERIRHEQDWTDRNIVKLVCAGDGTAMYFSRDPIPGGARFAGKNRLRHIGLYAYTAASLRAFAGLDVPELEHAEKLEQLRALHHGWKIQTALACVSAGIGVDTEDDLRRVNAAVS